MTKVTMSAYGAMAALTKEIGSFRQVDIVQATNQNPQRINELVKKLTRLHLIQEVRPTLYSIKDQRVITEFEKASQAMENLETIIQEKEQQINRRPGQDFPRQTTLIIEDILLERFCQTIGLHATPPEVA